VAGVVEVLLAAVQLLAAVGLVVVKDMAAAVALETLQRPVQAKVMMAVVLGQMAEVVVVV